MKSKTYSRIQVRAELKKLVAQHPNQKQAAKALKLSEQDVSDCLRYMKPSAKVLDVLQFNQVELYERKPAADPSEIDDVWQEGVVRG